jgi:UDP-N-acetylglucosamine 2-epimerase (non-hydrolysing)
MAPRICFIVGARPNFMKSAPVYQGLAQSRADVELVLVHTGQHYDAAMSSVFIDELGMPEPHLFLGVGSGSHAEQTARALVRVEQMLLEQRPSVVVVAGDVNSTLAAALAAAKLGIPIAHIESGLRSFDESMPEEANRRLTDHLSRILLVHSASALENLQREGIDAQRVHLVGNTMIDSVLLHLSAAEALQPWLPFGVAPGEFGLVTLHRPTLVDDPPLLRATVQALCELADDVPILFPVHPRTRARIEESGVHAGEAASGLRITEPLGYLAFLGLEAAAAFVLTDSGGVQEETSALGVPCFTFRENTERPVTVELGTNTLLGVRPDRIREIPRLLRCTGRPAEIPLWDGHAGKRAAGVLRDFVVDGRPPRGGGVAEPVLTEEAGRSEAIRRPGHRITADRLRRHPEP